MKMTWGIIEVIQELHRNFVNDFMEASQFDTRGASALPSLIFFFFSFILLHRYLHRHTNHLTSLQTIFYKELGVQWCFFFVIRLWFLLIACVKWLIKICVEALEESHEQEKLLWLNKVQIQATFFTFLTFVGMIPFSILLTSCFNQRHMPNFLMWVDEDPWLRSEIGLAGHYLQRPPRFLLPARKNYSYRSKRSTSFEYPDSKRLVFRNCQSLELIRDQAALSL